MILIQRSTKPAHMGPYPRFTPFLWWRHVQTRVIHPHLKKKKKYIYIYIIIKIFYLSILKKKLGTPSNSSAQHVIICIEHLKKQIQPLQRSPLFLLCFVSDTLLVCLFFHFLLQFLLCQVFSLVCLLDFQFADPTHVTKV